MSFNGAGVFSINTSGQPVVTATTIDPTVFNALTADLATGLSTAICKDGQTTPTANIPLGGFKLTGVGAATALTDAATLLSFQNGVGVYVGTVGGTADAITLTPSPAITAYVAGQGFKFIASGANTTNVTVAVSGLTAKAITKNGTTALVAGDIPSATMVAITYDGTRFILGTSGASIAAFTGTTAQFNTALSDNDFATLAGIETLTNKTFNSASNTLTLNLATGTLTGTTAQFNTALSDNDFATLAGSESLSNKTIVAPVLSGTVTGTYTLGGTPTVTGIITAGTNCVKNPYAVSSSTTQSHGLGVIPAFVFVYLENLTAELNYSIGDRVNVSALLHETSVGGQPTITGVADATNVILVIGSGTIQLPDKSIGTSTVITAANWKVVAVPYKVTA